MLKIKTTAVSLFCYWCGAFAFSANLTLVPHCCALTERAEYSREYHLLMDFHLLESTRLCMTVLHMKTLHRSQISVLSCQLSWNHCMSSVKITSLVPSSIGYEDILRQQATFLNLSVDKCPGILQTSQLCNSSPWDQHHFHWHSNKALQKFLNCMAEQQSIS